MNKFKNSLGGAGGRGTAQTRGLPANRRVIVIAQGFRIRQHGGRGRVRLGHIGSDQRLSQRAAQAAALSRRPGCRRGVGDPHAGGQIDGLKALAGRAKVIPRPVPVTGTGESAVQNDEQRRLTAFIQHFARREVANLAQSENLRIHGIKIQPKGRVAEQFQQFRVEYPCSCARHFLSPPIVTFSSR